MNGVVVGEQLEQMVKVNYSYVQDREPAYKLKPLRY